MSWQIYYSLQNLSIRVKKTRTEKLEINLYQKIPNRLENWKRLWIDSIEKPNDPINSELRWNKFFGRQMYARANSFAIK